jgi:hypothetical protein
MPRAPDPSAPEQRLVGIYQRAYADILCTIERKTAKGSLAAYERAVLVDVHRVLERLGVDMRSWATEEIPKLHLASAEHVYEAFIEAGADVPAFSTSFASIHQASVRVLADNVATQLLTAHGVVGRRVEGAIRQIQLEVIAGKQAAGLTVKDAQRRLVGRLGDEGLTCFTDSVGRQWRLDKYANMAARTVTREATNLGLMDQLRDMGRDLVQMSTHYASCEVCAPYAGRVFSLTGRTEGYPSLLMVPGFRSGYQVIHPNCEHVCLPWVEELDDNPEHTKAQSNRPFEDRRSRADVAAYETAQSEKRRANDDRHQWEAMRAWLPNDAPKTFAGFRRSKAANSERYRELKALEREARALAR